MMKRNLVLSILFLLMLVGMLVPSARAQVIPIDDSLPGSPNDPYTAPTSPYGVIYNGTPGIPQIISSFPTDGNVPTASANNTTSCFVKIDSLSTLLHIATCFLTVGIIPMLVTFAIIAFIWGVITYVIGKGDPKVLEKGRWYMVWGIVALFVMISVWGLVKVLGNTFGINAVLPLLPE